MDDFISILFKTKKENDTLVVNDDELDKWKEKLNKIIKDIDELVTDKLGEKYKPRYDQLILELDETHIGIVEITQELYYKAGVKEGAEIYETLKNK